MTYLRSAVAIGLVIIVLFPLVWLLLTSVKTTGEVQQLPVRWLPQNPTLEPILQTWFDTTGYNTEWPRFFYNTLKVTILTVLPVVAIGTMAGYGLARFQLPGTGLILGVFLVAQLFTGPALMIPIFVVVSRIGLYDTHAGLILVYIIFQTPIAIWLSYANFQNMPLELEEAAAVDGCTPLGAFLRITLPLSRIGLITVGLMSFLLIWSEYPFAAILLEKEINSTVSIGLAKFITAFNIYWNQMAAASLIVALPVLILLVFAQKYFVQGLTAGSGK
jgi:ABC-type glycerol-3-phosphate transport system permease component